MSKILLIWIAVINVIALIVYGADKLKAINRAWRIPEATLLLLALIGGPFGSLAAMLLFRHKIRKPKFTVSVPALALIWGLLLLKLL